MTIPLFLRQWRQCFYRRQSRCTGFLLHARHWVHNERQLIAALGGNLSIYLEASFQALVHILVSIVKLPCDVLGNSNKSPTTVPKPGDINQGAAVTVGALLAPGRNLEETLRVIFVELVNLKRQARRHEKRLNVQNNSVNMNISSLSWSEVVNMCTHC